MGAVQAERMSSTNPTITWPLDPFIDHLTKARIPYGLLCFLPRKKAMYPSGVNPAFRINLRSNPTPRSRSLCTGQRPP